MSDSPGRVFRAHLEGDGVPKSVVVKMPTLDTQARTAVCEDLEFYLCEVRFYQQIGLGSPLPPARPYYAEFDPATHDFVLVLEDLIGLRVADQTVGCTTHDAETVSIDVIAELHASWWNSERLPSLPWLRIYGLAARSPPSPPRTSRLPGRAPSRQSAATFHLRCGPSAGGSRHWRAGSVSRSPDRRTPSCTAICVWISCSSPSNPPIRR